MNPLKRLDNHYYCSILKPLEANSKSFSKLDYIIYKEDIVILFFIKNICNNSMC